MEVVVKPRQGGKSETILRLAAQHFSYIVCPTLADVQELWQRARELDLMSKLPQPITWNEFINHRYRSRGIRSFMIDDLDRCIQTMTDVEVKAVSLTGDTSPEQTA
jgi:hypothetical protein